MNHLVEATVLVPGSAQGHALLLTETLSFWGGFNPDNGQIIDVHHPQFQQCVTGKILFLAESRGSAGTPGGIAENLRNGKGPIAFVLGERDVNIAIGVMVANQLYQLKVPVLHLPINQFDLINQDALITIETNGVISLESC